MLHNNLLAYRAQLATCNVPCPSISPVQEFEAQYGRVSVAEMERANPEMYAKYVRFTVSSCARLKQLGTASRRPVGSSWEQPAGRSQLAAASRERRLEQSVPVEGQCVPRRARVGGDGGGLHRSAARGAPLTDRACSRPATQNLRNAIREWGSSAQP